MSERDKVIVEKYKLDIMSGRTFVLHASSARSRTGYMPPIARRDWAKANSVIADMACVSDPLAAIASRMIGRVNLYGDAAQATAALYNAAQSALIDGYTDVIRLASPEPGRRSDAKRDYTLNERVALLYWLEEACRPFSNGVAGVGWALAAVAKEIGYAHPEAGRG